MVVLLVEEEEDLAEVPKRQKDPLAAEGKELKQFLVLSAAKPV